MNLTPREKDKLLVAMAAMVARNRLQRGCKLNYPEAIALISDYVVEGARDGRSRSKAIMFSVASSPQISAKRAAKISPRAFWPSTAGPRIC